MYICDECRKLRNYPEGFCISRGRCELCGALADCHDIPKTWLPKVKTPLISDETPESLPRG